MSKILFLTNWPYDTRFQKDYYGSHSYFEGFKDAFNNANHNVLQINLLNFGESYNLDKNENSENCSILIEKIKSFNPDLIIVFSNQITKKIYKITNCPVLVWWCDDPSYFDYCGNKYVKEYQERIYFFVGNDGEIEYVKSKYKLAKNRIFLIKPSTGFYKKNVEQNKDITYVGGMYPVPLQFLKLEIIKKLHKNRAELCKALNKLQYDLDDKEGNDFFKKMLQTEDCRNDVLNICAYYQKTQFLISLASFFDLRVYCSLSYHRNILIPQMNNLDLMTSHHIDEPCDDIVDVINIYNSSKISINLNTANANRGDKGGFSWRVCDVMATNSCLISNISAGFDRYFSKWVKIPQFTTQQEAYDICKKLLDNENWRRDIVSGSQLAIKEGGFTFDYRVSELEEIFNLRQSKNKELSKYEFFVNQGLKINNNKNKVKGFLIKLYNLNLKILLNKLNLTNLAKRIFK